MKIQCQLCKEIVEIGSFQICGVGIEITCEACRGQFLLLAAGRNAKRLDGDPGETTAEAAHVTAPAPPNPRPSSPLVDLATGRMRCPKCEESQAVAEACVKCGLRAQYFTSYKSDLDDAVSEELQQLWDRCSDHWDSADAHERFLEVIAEVHAFAFAARRYRGHLRKDPDDAIAQKMLTRVGRMAEITLINPAVARHAAETAKGKEPFKNLVVMLIVLVLFGGAVGMYALLKGGNADAKPALPTRVK